MNSGYFDKNPNRHLWNNHGWWWMKYQPYHPVYTERVNINLRTRDIEKARWRRDLKLVEFMRGSLKGVAEYSLEEVA